MWMEVKAILTMVAVIFIAVVISQILLLNLFLGFILFMAMGIYVFGDIIIGWQITRNRAKYIIDKPPGGHVLALILTLNNMVDFEWARKGPHGKREFRYNSRDVSVIDKGEYPIHFPNGSIGFICHEKSADALDMRKVKYAEHLKKKFGTNNIKEIYAIMKTVDKNEDKI